MPGPRKQKGVNPKKLASGFIHNTDGIARALEGKHEIGLVLGTLGFGSFRIALPNKTERVVSICGRTFRGGEHSDFYVRRGDWLVVEGKEVQAILNRSFSDGFAELKDAGRIPDLRLPEDAAAGEDAPEGFAYEEGGEALKQAEASWTDPAQKAKSLREAAEMEQRVQQARDLVASIRARRAGLLARSAALPVVGEREDDRGLDLFAAAEAEAEEVPAEVPAAAEPADALAAHEARKSRAITSVRRLRKLGLLPAEPTEEERAEAAAEAERQRLLAEEDARLLAAELAAEAAEREMAVFAARAAVAESWEDLAGAELDAAIAAI
jgi:hypothetical protein